MSIQLASTDTLQAVLAAAPAANQLPIHASYVDQGGSGNNLPSITNGTTPVTFVASPASGVERLISQISICNDDTASATVTVNIVRTGTSTRLCKITLQPGYALYYDGGWKVLDTNGNFLCDVTVNSSSITSNQGTAAAITAPWPVELSNGTNAVGTSGSPLRIDPTGTTQQPVNITDLAGVALGGPTAWGTAPASGTEVINVNANIVAGASGGGNVNLTELNSVALGSPSAYGTSPGAIEVQGVNAFVTNTVAVSGIGTFTVSDSNFIAQASTTSGQKGLLIQGSVTTSDPTYTTAQTSPLSLNTSGQLRITLDGVAIPAGTNVIGAVTQSGTWTVQQGGSNWSQNVAQWGGSATTLGQKVSASSVPVVIASDQSQVSIVGISSLAQSRLLSTTAPSNVLNSSIKRITHICVTIAGAVTGGSTLSIADGSGNVVASFGINMVTAQYFPYIDMQGLNMPLINGGNSPTVSLSANLTSGNILIALAGSTT